MKKTGKKTEKGNPSFHSRFKKGHTPTATSQQKKEGRVRRKQGQEIMNDLIRLQSFTPNELITYLNDKGGNILLREYILIKYTLDACKGKFLVNYLNRFIPYVPKKSLSMS